MSFRVSVTSGSGHDDLDLEGDGAPDIHAFDTEAERLAFIAGVRLATSLTDGFVNGWAEAKAVDEALTGHVAAPGFEEAREFLLSVADLEHEFAAAKITEWLDLAAPGTNRLVPLVHVARDYREDGRLGGSPEASKVLDLLDVLKQALLGGS